MGITKLVSGGQSGADRAALAVAIKRRIPHGGWCPLHCRAEDGPIPPQFQLSETPTEDYAQRTEWNVRDSDATVIFTLSDGELEGGTALTESLAKEHGRPCLRIVLSEKMEEEAKGRALLSFHDFVDGHRVEVLNVAGPRESEAPGIGSAVKAFLERALSESNTPEDPVLLRRDAEPGPQQMNQGNFTRSALFGPATNDAPPTAGEQAMQEKQLAKRRAKRKKPRWRERVAPAEPQEEPKEDIIDEATLTRCTRCPPHRNRTGKFRPLIGSGEHVCDDCYQREFPCTAMLDDHDQPELLRMGRRASNVLRNKIVDNVADIMGTTQSTPDEEIHRNSKGREEFPSEVECRFCLERGVFRRCCASYYCHGCYYQSGKCPGCEIEAPLTGVADLKPDPGRWAVGLSWALSVLLVVLAFAGAVLVYWNASTTPVTVWGHACRGWLSDCNLAVCLDNDGGGGFGEGGAFIPPSQPYKVCDRASTADQVVGSACIYDHELYAWSNHRIGYDICVSSPREESYRPRNASSPDPLLLFSNNNQSGVYVFDDDFELPVREASAPWSEIINGDRSTVCGVNSKAVERGNHGGYQPLPNVNALVFSGVQTRHAATAGLDIRHGGRVEFFLKMGPILVDGEDSDCKAAFSDVILEYRTAASNWVIFRTYSAWKYRGIFKFVSEEIPGDAWSNATQFRFIQPSFDVLRDHWAIDDVRIWANLMPQWETASEFEERREHQSARVKLAQCCYGTDQCSVFEKKKTKFTEDQCDALPGFDSSVASSRLRLSELLVLYMALITCAKALYRLVALRFTRRASKMKRGKAAGAVQLKDAELFPNHTFHSTTHLSWQNTWVLLLVGAFVCTAYRLLDALMIFECLANETADDPSCKTDASFIVACIFAALFDAGAMRELFFNVICVTYPWKRKPLEVVVDLHPERGFMRVGAKAIPLSEVSDVKTQRARFNGFISILLLVGGLPWALGSLTIQSFDLSDGSTASSMPLGYVAILRVIFGPSLFVKFCLTVEWILSFKMKDRDDFGRAVSKGGLLQQSLIGANLAPVVFMISIASRRVENVSAGDNFILYLIYAAFGGLCGLLLGVMHGLPVIPDAKLTGWPGTCCSVSYYERTVCPCLFSCNHCGEIHSRQKLLVVSLDDMITFKRFVAGGRVTVEYPELYQGVV